MLSTNRVAAKKLLRLVCRLPHFKLTVNSADRLRQIVEPPLAANVAESLRDSNCPVTE